MMRLDIQIIVFVLSCLARCSSPRQKTIYSMDSGKS